MNTKNKKILLLMVFLSMLFCATQLFAEEEAGGAKPDKVVAAVDPSNGQPVYVKELVQSKAEPKSLVDSDNFKIEMAPYSVVEFLGDGSVSMLRGSVYVESKKERKILTPASQYEFIGQLVLSYDYKERSSSGFVMQGQARMQNPHQADHSAMLDKNQGATMVVGDVYPTAVRGLDPKKTAEWLTGYGWGEEKKNFFLKGFPAQGVASRSPALEDVSPEKLATKVGDPMITKEQALVGTNTKLEDYFSSIDTGDDKPHYYEDKLSTTAQLGGDEFKKNQKKKGLDPEDAALIPLPNVRIDTELPKLTVVSPEEQKIYEEQITAPTKVAKKDGKKSGRGLASVLPVKTKKKFCPKYNSSA